MAKVVEVMYNVVATCVLVVLRIEYSDVECASNKTLQTYLKRQMLWY